MMLWEKNANLPIFSHTYDEIRNNGRGERPSFNAGSNTLTGTKFDLTPRISVHARQFALRLQAAQHSPLLQFSVSWSARVSGQAAAMNNRCLLALFKQGAESVKLKQTIC
jgi:hypothetical protein